MADLFELPRGLIKVTGPEGLDFLQRITSQDIKKLGSDEGARSALLTGNGNVICLFDIFHCGNFYLISIEREFLEKCLQSLEKLHFAEDLEIKNISEEFKFFSVQGEESHVVLMAAFGRFPKRDFEIVGTEDAFLAHRTDFFGPGFHVFIKKENATSALEKLKFAGSSVLTAEMWSSLRAEAGYFSFGHDIDENNLIMEAPAAKAVSRDKGCYPGQETVERIFTYGNISKKLMGLKFSSAFSKGESRVKLLSEGTDAGYVTSVHSIPWNNETVGFGMVRKPFYEDGQKLFVQGTDVNAEVFTLPESFNLKETK